MMLEAAEFADPIGIRLLDSIEYYEIVFQGINLLKNESDFRTNKLSMILEVMRAIRIPEDLETKLSSAIIAAWRLKVPGSTIEQRLEERDVILQSIRRIKAYTRWAKGHPKTGFQLDLTALIDLPLTLTDIEPAELPKVQNLLYKTKQYLSSLIDRRSIGYSDEK
jgi:hypothetical protein